MPDEILEDLRTEQSAARFHSIIEGTDAIALFVAVDGPRLGAFCGVFRHAVLWVVAANAQARSFYTRHGWSNDGVLDHYDAGGHRVLEVRYSRTL